MGKEGAGLFLKSREIFYNNWRTTEFSHPDFPFENLNALLVEAGEAPLMKNDIRLPRFKYKITVTKLKQRIHKN